MDSMPTIKWVVEAIGGAVHTSLILLVAIGSSLCLEFDRFPYLEGGLFCAISIVFFILSVEFKLVLIALPGVFFYVIVLFQLVTEPYLEGRVSERIQVLICFVNLSMDVLAPLCAILKNEK